MKPVLPASSNQFAHFDERIRRLAYGFRHKGTGRSRRGAGFVPYWRGTWIIVPERGNIGYHL